MKDSCKRMYWLYMAVAVPWTILLFVTNVQSQVDLNSPSLKTLLDKIKITNQQYDRLRQETDRLLPELKEYKEYLEELKQNSPIGETPKEVVDLYEAFADSNIDSRQRKQILSFLNEAKGLSSLLWLSNDQIESSEKVKVYKTICKDENTTRNLSKHYKVESRNPSDIAKSIIQVFERARERIISKQQRFVQNNGYLSASATMWLLDYEAACFQKKLVKTAIERMKPEGLKDAEERLRALNNKLALLAPGLVDLTADAKHNRTTDLVADEFLKTLFSTDIAASPFPAIASEAAMVTKDPGKDGILITSMQGSDTSINSISEKNDNEFKNGNTKAAYMPVKPDKKYSVASKICVSTLIIVALGLIMFGKKRIMKSKTAPI